MEASFRMLAGCADSHYMLETIEITFIGLSVLLAITSTIEKYFYAEFKCVRQTNRDEHVFVMLFCQVYVTFFYAKVGNLLKPDDSIINCSVAVIDKVIQCFFNETFLL